MKIEISIAPYPEMRYETAGDWQFRGDDLHIMVADLGDWRMECCVAFHEMAEALICRWQGITEETVDEFDFAFTGDGEPGDDPACPYRTAHRIASALEFALALALDLDWKVYEERIESL